MQTIKVSNTADMHAAFEAGYTKDQIEIVQADHTAAINAAREEGKAAGIAEAKAAAIEANKTITIEAAKAERARLTELASLVEPGFEAEYKAAVEGGHSPEKFAYDQQKAAKDRGVTLGAIRKESKGAQHAAAPEANQASAEIKSGWNQVVARLTPGKKAA